MPDTEREGAGLWHIATADRKAVGIGVQVLIGVWRVIDVKAANVGRSWNVMNRIPTVPLDNAVRG